MFDSGDSKYKCSLEWYWNNNVYVKSCFVTPIGLKGFKNTKLCWWKWHWTAFQINKWSWTMKTCGTSSLLRLAYILPLLESMHALIKFAQMRDISEWSLVVVLKVC